MKERETRNVLLGSIPSAFAGVGVGYLTATSDRVVDWAATGTMIQGWAALLAAVAAAWGVNRWQKEIRFRRNLELAEKVMVAVIGMRRAIDSARREAHEWDMAQGDQGEVEDFLDFYGAKNRQIMLQTAQHNYAEVVALRDRVAVVFSLTHAEALDDFASAYKQIGWALSQIMDMSERAEKGADEPFGKHMKSLRILYSNEILGREENGIRATLNIENSFHRVREAFSGAM